MKSFLLLIFATIALTGCSRPGAEQMFNKAVNAQIAGQYDMAIEAYKELIKAHPDSARTPEAYYAIGSIYQNHKYAYYEAIQTYRQLVEKFPNHATAPSASFLIGFIYNNDLKNIDSARIAYQDFIKKYPNDQLTGSAEFELSNLGKSADEILKQQSKIASKETRPASKGKKR